MAKFTVILRYDACETVEIEAEDAEQARDIAAGEGKASLCHYCARSLDLGDVFAEIVLDADGNEVEA